MASLLDIVEIMPTLNSRSAVGRIVVNPPRSTPDFQATITGNIKVCCGRAFLTDESYNQHVTHENGHSVDRWNEMLLKNAVVELIPLSESLKIFEQEKINSAKRAKEQINFRRTLSVSKGRKPHGTCKLCGCLMLKANILRHMRTAHSAEGKYHCRWCACCYRSRAACMQHSSKCHPKEHKTFFFDAAMRNEHVISARNMTGVTFNKSNDVDFGKHSISSLNEQTDTLKPKSTAGSGIFNARKIVDIHECIFCGKILNSKLKFQDHLLIHTGAKPYKCKICKKDFSFTCNLSRHIKKTHPESLKYKCVKCPGLFYITQEHLERHIQFKHRQQSISNIPENTAKKIKITKKSEKTIKFQSPIQRTKKEIMEMTAIKVDNGFQCKICGSILKKNSYYKAHLRTHTNNFPYKCPKCPKRFRTNGSCRSHTAKSHVVGGEFKCELCPCVFSVHMGLKSHHRIYHHKDRTARVADAAVEKRTKSEQKQIRNNCKDEFFKTEDGKYSCKICGKVLVKLSSIAGHMLIHSNEFPHECEICKGKFRLKSTLYVHMRLSHAENGKFECTKCPCKFLTNQGLLRHSCVYHNMTALLNQKNNLLGKGKKTKDHKTSQKRKIIKIKIKSNHMGKKAAKNSKSSETMNSKKNEDGNYECSTCGKILASSTGLVNHMLIHTNEFPHHCKKCGAKFRLRSTLNRHVETNHVANGKYECHLCSCTFALYRGLRRHHFCYHTGTRLADKITNFKKKSPVKKASYKKLALEKSHSSVKQHELSPDCNPLTPPSPVPQTDDDQDDQDSQWKSDKLLTKKEVFRLKPIHNDGGFQCPICGKILKSFQTFRLHRVVHCKTYDYQCSCGNQFRRDYEYKHHLRTSHVENGEFKCIKCTCTFASSSALQSHSILHSVGHKMEAMEIPVTKGKKANLKCSHCSKTFVTPQSRKLHESLHTGKKDYTCDFCQQNFRLYSTLFLHIKKFSVPDGNYHCGLCGSSCESEESLQHHMSIHKYTKKT